MLHSMHVLTTLTTFKAFTRIQMFSHHFIFCVLIALATLKPQAGITAAVGSYAAPAPQPVSN